MEHSKDIQRIDDIDNASPCRQLDLTQLAEEERRINEDLDGISDPIVAYTMGFDSFFKDCADGDWDYEDWMALRMSYMRCAPERFWRFTVRYAYAHGVEDGCWAAHICGPVY